MSLPLEWFGLIGDGESVALVSREGSIDWLCLPRFDSPACCAALLGTPEHGHWSIGPVEPVQQARQQYEPDTLILQTELTCASGTIRLTDFMPPREHEPVVVRIVSGMAGRVKVAMTAALRFDYGKMAPWIVRCEGADADAAAGWPGRGEFARRERGGRNRTRRGVRGARVERGRAARVRAEASLFRSLGRVAAACGARCRSGARCNAAALASMDRSVRPAHRVSRSAQAFLDHAEGTRASPDRRTGRRAHHVTARKTRRQAQLGLPLLLAARCEFHGQRAASMRLPAARRRPGATGCCARWRRSLGR